MEQHYDTAVVGGGVIGASIAYQLAKRGQKVILLERGRMAGQASAAAAGILGAQVEIDEPGPMFDLVRTSRAMFPTLSEELRERTGIDIGLLQSGALKVALDGEQAERFQQTAGWQSNLGETIEWLTPAAALQKEPLLSGQFTGALYAPGEGQVSAPDLSLAFAKAAASQGVEIFEHTEVTALQTDGEQVCGVLTRTGRIYSEHVVIAAGAWSSTWMSDFANDGLANATWVNGTEANSAEVSATGRGHPELPDSGETGSYAEQSLPVYPIKGECFSVLTYRPLLQHTVFSEGCYLVPKKGGRLIVGATVVPHSFDCRVSFQGLYHLMEKARALLPSIEQAEIEDSWAGLRPMSADGLPLMGEDERLKSLYYATGHYRNGILLSPVTGVLIADWITGEQAGVEVDASFFHPARLNQKASDAVR